VAELLLKVTGDTRDVEAKLAGLKRSAEATTRSFGVLTGELTKAYGGIGRFADQASTRVQQLERNANRAAEALRRANVEARGGGRIGGRSPVGGAGLGGAAGGGGGLGAGIRSGVGDYASGLVGGGIAGGTAAALTGAAVFAKESFAASVEGARAAAFLESTARRAQVSYADLRGEVQLLRREFNLSQTDAERALAQAERLARLAGRSGQGGSILRATIRAATGAGLSPDEAPTLLRQISSGEDEAFDRLLGVNPSTLYAQEASRTGRSASSLSDQEKFQIRINAVLREGNQSLDAYNRYLDSAAGKVDRLSSLWADVKRLSGDAISSVFSYLPAGAAVATAFQGANLAMYGAPQGAGGGRSVLDYGAGVLDVARGGGNLLAQAYAALQARQQAQRDRISGFSDVATEARWQGILRERDIANAEYRALPDRIAGLRGQQSALQQSLAQGALGIFALQNRRAALGETPETAGQLRARIFGTADTLGGRAGAQYTIEALGQYDPRRLSTEARDRLRAALDTEIKARTDEEREKMRLLAKIGAHLEQLVSQQAPKTAIAGEKTDRPVDVRIEDASPTATASITNVQRGGVGSVAGSGDVVDFPL
jgi:hypothetical protein